MRSLDFKIFNILFIHKLNGTVWYMYTRYRTELFVFVCLAVYFCSCDNILTLVNFEKNEDPCKNLFDVKR